ncbi:MAG TPA: sigma-70 family RNA polymerase sigma factor [Flavipsychrobacter sp.]|nr:sigma-70 family RNA polymerase sigma factor [Flavipsychrobacter sp.]
MELYQELSEVVIIERILLGEKSLYEIIVRRLNPYLYKIGRSYSYNHDDTQDLMQDTFIDAYKSLSQFEGRANFKTWIIRIMINNCYRKKEKSSFKNERTLEIHEHAQPLYATMKQDTQHIVQNRELGHILEEALGQLAEDYRMVFSLREINGLSVAETASVLNITEENVKVRLHRAKSMLRKEVEKSYSPNELFEFHATYCNAMTTRVMSIINEL